MEQRFEKLKSRLSEETRNTWLYTHKNETKKKNNRHD